MLDALAEAGDRVTVLLVGREAEVRAELDRLGGAENETLRVVDAPQAIGMGESPTVWPRTTRRKSFAGPCGS